MSQIIECVPNFSEGRNSATIDAIAQSITKVKNVKLLGVEPDKDYNRTVVTFVGSADAVKEAAFQSTKTALELIDMREHKGEHPRLGAVDVVPFIPVSETSMDECIAISKEYAERTANELKIPVFLYGEAATKPQRKNLADIRKGEYEGLETKLADADWKPDYGKAEFVPKSGALVTGARFFLIAYNVNLDTDDSSIAHEIALRINQLARTLLGEHPAMTMPELYANEELQELEGQRGAAIIQGAKEAERLIVLKDRLLPLCKEGSSIADDIFYPHRKAITDPARISEMRSA